MGIKSVFFVIGKNFRILFRSKLSTISAILFPLLVILFIGFAFNSSGIGDISVGIYSMTNTTLIQDITDNFLERFSVRNFDDQNGCIDSIKKREIQVCVVFPDDFSETGSFEYVNLYVDNSRVNLAYLVLHEIESEVSISSSEIGIILANDLIDTLNSVKNSLLTEKSKIFLSKNTLAKINSVLNEDFSTPDIQPSINALKSIKGSLEDPSDQSKVDSTIDDLEELKVYILNSTSNFNEISSYNQEIDSRLDEVNNDIDVLIKKIGSSNILEAEKIVSPVKTKIVSVNQSSNNRDYMIPTIVSLVALFGGILLSSGFVLKERKTKAYFRNFMVPTKNVTFLIGNYITCLIILIFQFVLVFLGIELIFKMSITSGIFEILVILLLSLSAFIFIGAFIGYLFRSEETIIFGSVLIAALLMLFSNTILPIEVFFNSLKVFANFNPLVICDFALRKIILFGYGFNSILKEIYILMGFITVFFVLSLIVRKTTKKIL